VPGRSAAVIEVAQAAADDRRRLARLTAPVTWLVTGLPYLAGMIEAGRGPSPLVLVGLFFFTAPYALLRRGLLDIHRPGADPDRSEALVTRFAIVVVVLPFLIVLVLAGGAAAAVALLVAVALVLADVAPPLRLRDRPFVDHVVAGLGLAVPAIVALLLAGISVAALPWAAFVALAAWGAGTSAMLALTLDAAGHAGDGALAGGSGAHGRPATPTVALILDVPTGTIQARGVVPTAALALVAYLAAAAATVTLGYLGWLAALGLVLFALPPLMVLAAGRDDAGTLIRGPAPSPPGHADATATPTIAGALAVVAAAARSARTVRVATAAANAWAEVPPLIALEAALLVVLVLQHRSITTYGPWTVAILLPAALIAYALANVVAIRVAGRRHGTPDASRPADAAIPSLTIVVPTRDAVASLPGCLAAIRAQTYPETDVLVVDDASTDGSREEAGAWIGEDVVVDAPARPDRWSSHAWCCRVGAGLATTDLVLFVDPDTILAPIAARILVEQLEARRDALLVGLPRSAMPTAGERAAVPGFALVRYGFAPIWWTAVTGGRPAWLTVRDGPLMLVRRDAYLAIGGHGPTAGEASLDRAGDLTASFARAGQRVGVIRLAKLAATRRYLDTAGAVAGWRARIVPDGRGTIAGAVLITAVTATAYLVPLLLPPAAILAGVDVDLLAAACTPLLLLVVLRIVLSIVDRQPARAIAWHPVTMLLTLIGQAGGIVDHVAGRHDADLDGHAEDAPVVPPSLAPPGS
jgi:Glycosyl transferase family 2